VSIARWNLEEAAGKTLARRTETAYEAVTPDEKAIIFKVRYLYGRREDGGGDPASYPIPSCALQLMRAG
jgi:hypothetical protein